MKQLFNAKEFFFCFFPDCYVFARSDINGAGGQTAGSIPCYENPDKLERYYYDRYYSLNQNGYGLHFTPNAVKTLDDKNKKQNLLYYNAFFIDIDSPNTKEIVTENDKLDRENFKTKVKNMLKQSVIPPSLVSETRNGFHVYWFIALYNQPESLEEYNWIQARLSEEFDGDRAALGAMHSLRLPYTMYHKNGEKGWVLPVEELSTFKFYKTKDLLNWVGTRKTYIENQPLTVYTLPKSHPFTDVTSYSIRAVIEKLSGTSYVKGDQFRLIPHFGGGKYNVLVNGKSSPNWIDTNLNMVFSNNMPGFCNIFHFLNWYGMTNKQVYELLKNMFN